jgi:hypothetical protein
MSEPDELLERLGGLEREYDDAFPHVWEDVVRGDRTAAEARAEREGIDDPRELRALAEVLRPLGAEEREAWVERLAAGLGAPEERPSPASSSEPAGPVAVVSLQSRARPRPRARMVWLGGAGASLAAAALVLWVLRPRDEAPGGRVADEAVGLPEAAALPGFELLVRNETVRENRSTSDPEAVARYQPSSSVHWVIRPERSVAPPLGLRVLAEASSPELRLPQRRLLLDPGAIEVSPRGVIELRGRLEDVLPLAVGRWSLRMVVAAPDVLPAELAAFDAGGAWVVSDAYVIDVIP